MMSRSEVAPLKFESPAPMLRNLLPILSSFLPMPGQLPKPTKPTPPDQNPGSHYYRSHRDYHRRVTMTITKACEDTGNRHPVEEGVKAGGNIVNTVFKGSDHTEDRAEEITYICPTTRDPSSRILHQDLRSLDCPSFLFCQSSFTVVYRLFQSRQRVFY